MIALVLAAALAAPLIPWSGTIGPRAVQCIEQLGTPGGVPTFGATPMPTITTLVLRCRGVWRRYLVVTDDGGQLCRGRTRRGFRQCRRLNVLDFDRSAGTLSGQYRGRAVLLHLDT